MCSGLAYHHWLPCVATSLQDGKRTSNSPCAQPAGLKQAHLEQHMSVAELLMVSSTPHNFLLRCSQQLLQIQDLAFVVTQALLRVLL